MAKRKRKHPGRRSHSSKKGGRRRSHKGMPSWAVLGVEVLVGALLGSIAGPLLPDALVGEALGIGLMGLVDKRHRSTLVVTGVALEAMAMAQLHFKPLREAQHAVATAVGVKRIAAAGGGTVRIDDRTAGNVVKNIAGAARIAGGIP